MFPGEIPMCSPRQQEQTHIFPASPREKKAMAESAEPKIWGEGQVRVQLYRMGSKKDSVQLPYFSG